MKFISEQQCSEMISLELSRYPEAKKHPMYLVWSRIQRYVTLLILFLSVLLVFSTPGLNKTAILRYFDMAQVTGAWWLPGALAKGKGAVCSDYALSVISASGSGSFRTF